MSQLPQTPYLLVATPQLLDPNFAQSVVLVISHGDDGAMGYIMNRVTSHFAHEIVVSQDESIPEKIPVWFGGPVMDDRALIIYPSELYPSSEASYSQKGISLSSSIDLLKHPNFFSDEGKVAFPMRFLIGYAGWGASQLEEEVDSGAWLKCETDINLLFDTPIDLMWQKALDFTPYNPMSGDTSNIHYLN